MTTLNEKEKRDFATQVAVITEQNAQQLIDAGFDPATRVGGLRSKITEADEAEGRQKDAQAAALDATKASNEALASMYADASAFVKLIEGLLGKDNSLVRKLKQLRS
ncbi:MULTISPECIES: hypothetical protein [Draconibacterium]|uniref:hypothetical protein n=1 Tax=Draconibacterium TaxID=1471399 RepID=UPI0013D5ACE6|nr:MULTISPECIES: hypothetical protein [Draconibacterium]